MSLWRFSFVSLLIHFLIVLAIGMTTADFSLPMSGGKGFVSVELQGAPVSGEGSAVKERLVRDAEKGRADYPEGTGSGDEGIDHLLAEIRSRIERETRYPYLAQKIGAVGTALVRFRIDEGGRPTAVEVARSAGHQILDEEARGAVLRGAPYPLYPKPLTVSLTFTEKGR